MNYVRLYETPEGDSRFETRALPLPGLELSHGNLPMGMSAPLAAGDLTFFHLPVGWVQEWHQAPRRQYVIVLHGAMRIETGDGRNCLIGPGDTLLVEDISGKGHRTTVPEGDCRGIVVTIPD